MKKIHQYKCTLLSDVILTSMATTEGYKESLNYISGAKFMGIVARQLYHETDIPTTLAIFHNGTVHFSDATPMIDGTTTAKVPFSWFYEKGKKLSDPIYLHHNLLNESETKTMQLRQARDGYFSVEKQLFITLEQDFSIKSAYDIDNRKSKDSQMYGYFSLKKGTSWSFSVADTEGVYAERIKAILIGKHQIGKSKSAEYGLVNIECLSENIEETGETYKNEVLVYAQSNLCFYDDFGKCTALPTTEQLVGTPNASIVWKKSQVRSRNYQTWNGKRNNRDADRLIIESGSVFFVELKEAITTEFFTNGIGAYRNEGFGKVLINPNFLMSPTEQLSFTLQKGQLSFEKHYAYVGDEGDDILLECLEKRQMTNKLDYTIDEKVNQFINDPNNTAYFRGISKSQWGILRNYAKNVETIKIFKILVLDDKTGFLYRGKSESEWRKNGRREKLSSYLLNLEIANPEEYLPFVVKLSNQMAKTQ